MTRKLRLDPVSMERVAYPGGFHCDSGTRPEHASCFFLLSLRSLLDQLKKLQAMVTEIANKTSSGSTCVLVLVLSFCLLLVPAMYSSDARGSVPAEYVGKRLKDTFRRGLW